MFNPARVPGEFHHSYMLTSEFTPLFDRDGKDVILDSGKAVAMFYCGGDSLKVKAPWITLTTQKWQVRIIARSIQTFCDKDPDITLLDDPYEYLQAAQKRLQPYPKKSPSKAPLLALRGGDTGVVSS